MSLSRWLDALRKRNPQLDGGITLRRPLQPAGWRAGGSLTPGRGVMPVHGWIFSCLSSIPTNCSIRQARVSAFFAV
jgi:hypothetical protein